MSKILFGLGNFPFQYNNTRHNIGSDVCKSLEKYSFEEYKCESYESKKCKINDTIFFLLTPLTLMNSSGGALSDFLHKNKKYTVKDVIVIQDDVSLSLGQVKFTFNGGHNGHNGIKNVQEKCTSKFYRIRIGIGKNPYSLSKYVLDKFTSKESVIIKNIYKQIDSSIQDILEWNKSKLGGIFKYD